MGTTGKSPGGNRPTARLSAKPATTAGHSSQVFRRRRQVVGILVLLVIAALVTGGIFISGLLGNSTTAGNDAGTNPAAGGTTAKPKPAAKPGTPPSAVCDEAGIKVTAAMDKPSYGLDEMPVLTLRVTNTGKAPCDINVGTSQMEYQITSGDDIIFNSKNCQLDPTDLVKNLAPGASESANLKWKVNRNAPDCAPVVSEPGRGGATYVLVATLGKWSSEKVTFTLQ